MDEVNVAQEEQEHPAVELIDGFIAKSKLFAQDDLVGAIGEDLAGRGRFGRAHGRGHGPEQGAAGQAENLAEQVASQSEE
jgi:hypothetical protein